MAELVCVFSLWILDNLSIGFWTKFGLILKIVYLSVLRIQFNKKTKELYPYI